MSAQAPLSRISFGPVVPSSSVRLDGRFRQLAAAFGAFSADFSLAQADGEISSEESTALRAQLAELERWCRSMREDLGRAAAETESTVDGPAAGATTQTPAFDEIVPTRRK
jgi:hypothetical protein